MSNTFNLGNGNWATKKEAVLAYNSENNNFKPLPFDFDRASTATVVNKDGLIETVGVDEPRIDFLNNTKGHLLLEPQRRNLITYSEELTNNWTRSSISTPTDADVDAPDGATTVKRLQTNNADGSIAFTYNTTFNQVSGTTYTVSVYAKSYDGTNQLFGIFGNGSGASNLHTGNLTATNEWQRFTYTFTASNTSTIGLCKGNDRLAFDILFWGFQVEEGSYATSYIPTSGLAETRSAENSVTNLNLPSDVQPTTEGTFYGEIQVFDADASGNRNWISLDGGTGGTDDRILVYFLSEDSAVRGQVKSNSGANTVSFSGGVISDNQVIKFAVAFKTNYVRFYVNGTKKGFTDSYTLSISELNNIRFSYTGQNEMNLRDLRVYNTALSDTELQALTTI